MGGGVPGGDLGLGGEEAALNTRLQKLVEEKRKSTNESTQAVLDKLPLLRVKSAAQSGYEIDCYAPNAGEELRVGMIIKGSVSVGMAVMSATGASARMSYVEGTPPKETVEELKNKIFLVERLHMSPQ